MGMRGIRPSITVVARADPSDGWFETIEAGDTLWDEMSDGTLTRLFEGQRRLREEAGTPERVRIRIPDGCPVLRHGPDGGGAVVHLGLPRGHLFASMQLTEQEWACLQAWQRQEDVPVPADLAAKAARAGLIDV
jgi:hypothetical protein